MIYASAFSTKLSSALRKVYFIFSKSRYTANLVWELYANLRGIESLLCFSRGVRFELTPGDISCIIGINFLPRVKIEAYFTILIKLHHSLVDGVSLDVVL